ncbi:hypothetical protein ACXU4B_11715 [Dyella soli]|uniref:Uncharacterized protein n=1 Tax=Dyella soli TaxID=522319 RepID=A0A4R0YG50_9GAMM|nr:hypothetical protein [Dyella soli]TCI07174.1 hypothetical protein EZM97_31720 [Dyella soli]
MDYRCLVLSGRLLDGQDPATVHARLAAAFGMELGGFRERVFERAPLIIRRGLDAATADAQATQLRGLGVEADVLPDSDTLVWLRRDQQIRGPLPKQALDHYARSGDQWCDDGGQTWFAWQPASEGAIVPPPLPASEAPPWTAQPHDLPPPLPASTPVQAPTAKTPLSSAAIVAILFGVLALLWYPLAPVAVLLALLTLAYLYRRPSLRGRPHAAVALALAAMAFVLWMAHPAPTRVAQPYVPRPLQPLAAQAPAVAPTAVACAAKAAAPKNDEDRFLLTGQRLLTGRAQRKGDTYVAEAAVSVDDQCHPGALQLYVFRHGVFIGTALETAASLAGTRLTDFDLIDDQHLRVTLAQCTDKPGDCAATTVKQFAVLPGGGGWTLGEVK